MHVAWSRYQEIYIFHRRINICTEIRYSLLIQADLEENHNTVRKTYIFPKILYTFSGNIQTHAVVVVIALPLIDPLLNPRQHIAPGPLARSRKVDKTCESGSLRLLILRYLFVRAISPSRFRQRCTPWKARPRHTISSCLRFSRRFFRTDSKGRNMPKGTSRSCQSSRIIHASIQALCC